MGQRGTKPKPTHLKLVEGNPGKRPINRREPPVHRKLETLDPPSWLAGLSAEIWNEIVPLLDGSGILTRAEIHSLSMGCVALAEHRELTKQIEEEGRFMEIPVFSYKTGEQTGTKRIANPAVAMRHKAFEEALKILVYFGMTPSSRSQIIMINEKESGNKSDRFFA